MINNLKNSLNTMQAFYEEMLQMFFGTWHITFNNPLCNTTISLTYFSLIQSHIFYMFFWTSDMPFFKSTVGVYIHRTEVTARISGVHSENLERCCNFTYLLIFISDIYAFLSVKWCANNLIYCSHSVVLYYLKRTFTKKEWLMKFSNCFST